MKKLLLVTMILVFSTVNVFADAFLMWEKSERATGYKVYYGQHSKIVGDVLEYRTDDLGLTPGVEYEITVTAFNTAGESPKSNPVTYTRPAFVPDESPEAATITIPEGVKVINIQMR